MENTTQQSTSETTCSSHCGCKMCNGFKKGKWIIKKIVCLFILLVIFMWIDSSYNLLASMKTNKISKNTWQAVFLNNGQVYFGHLTRYGFKSWKLSNVYYIAQTKVPAQQPQISQDKKDNSVAQEPQAQTQTSLVKISQDLHAPEDVMYIPENNVAYWENLQSNSQVVQTIMKAGK